MISNINLKDYDKFTPLITEIFPCVFTWILTAMHPYSHIYMHANRFSCKFIAIFPCILGTAGPCLLLEAVWKELSRMWEHSRRILEASFDYLGACFDQIGSIIEVCWKHVKECWVKVCKKMHQVKSRLGEDGSEQICPMLVRNRVKDIQFFLFVVLS